MKLGNSYGLSLYFFKLIPERQPVGQYIHLSIKAYTMKRVILLSLLLLCISGIQAKDPVRYTGFNILQIPALTLNAHMTYDVRPFLSATADAGFCVNYESRVNFDVPGVLLTAHVKIYDGYSIDRVTGPYLKAGGYLNFRSSFEKRRYFHLGVFLNNSFVSESGTFKDPGLTDPETVNIRHILYIYGLSSSAGIVFPFSERIRSSLDFQLSFPSKNYKNLYGYGNFIPGMGYNGTKDLWFPMIIWNLEFKLK